MNQNNLNQNKNASPHNLYSFNEEKILEIKNRIEKLSNICQDLNPYQPISEILKIRLADFGILELSDPFKVTNTLLMLLEDNIEELHILCPLSDAEKNHEIL
jgi:hypothetical protein